MRKTVIYSGVVALLVSLLTIGAFLYLSGKKENLKIQYVDKTPAVEAKYNDLGEARVASLDFTQTAAKVMDGVVHIKSTMTNLVGQQGGPSIPEEFRDFFQRFFGQIPEQTEPVPQVGTGSGVIINENGYIVTNNHVVANASDIEVTLHDNRVFKAKVVGTDPTTDLALIRIKAEGLPTLPLANSNQVKVGEWVLAVGNPFNLNSTVTAGIISATGRNINILRDQYAIESFLQTDAAINPGNSGGALVNLDGGLVGINTAIASPTGAYSGYGFAVPSNIVNKVVEDLMKYGTVQRGYLGVGIRSVTAQLAEQENLDVVQGVYVDSLLVNSAAKAAGIKAGDVITEIDGRKLTTAGELQEVIAQRRPGDRVEILVDRKGQHKVFNVTLNSRDTSLAAGEEETSLNAMLGARFETVDKKAAEKLGIEGGVKVTELSRSGKLSRETNMREGFIITKVDGKQVKDRETLLNYLKDKSGGVLLEGIYENYPGVYYYAFGMEQ